MSFLTLLALPLLASAQLVGDEVPEVHPPLTWSRCSATDGCTGVPASVVLDAEYRWLHINDSYTNCFTGGIRYQGGIWETCESNADCTARCALEGGDSAYDRQMDFEEKSVTMRWHQYFDFSEWMNTRIFLLESEDRYQTFSLMYNELAFDVDLSTVPCGLNAALRFVAMDADGGMERYPTQKAGAKYGTGYCDAFCPRGLRYVGGEANMEGWAPASEDPDGGEGYRGACCSEMSVWNSNSISYTLDSRPCIHHGYEPCINDNCDVWRYGGDIRNPKCARDGCSMNPFRVGNPDFYGPGKVVDTNKTFTVVTQFQESGVKQFFIQDGKKIEPPAPTWEGIPASDGGITEEYCDATPGVFEERDIFNEVGGWHQHTDALRTPMVLSMSIQDDYWAYNLWLDGENYPLHGDPALPGYMRGPCGVEESDPWWVKGYHRKAAVTFSNIRFGPVGTTVDVD